MNTLTDTILILMACIILAIAIVLPVSYYAIAKDCHTYSTLTSRKTHMEVLTCYVEIDGKWRDRNTLRYDLIWEKKR